MKRILTAYVLFWFLLFFYVGFCEKTYPFDFTIVQQAQTGENCCETCISMLTGASVKEVEEYAKLEDWGWRSRIIETLKHFNIDCANSFTKCKGYEGLPQTAILILDLEYGSFLDTTHKKHCILYHNRTFHNPWYATPTDHIKLKIPGIWMKVSEYLQIYGVIE